jgi:hypothetical protein
MESRQPEGELRTLCGWPLNLNYQVDFIALGLEL